MSRMFEDSITMKKAIAQLEELVKEGIDMNDINELSSMEKLKHPILKKLRILSKKLTGYGMNRSRGLEYDAGFEITNVGTNLYSLYDSLKEDLTT